MSKPEPAESPWARTRLKSKAGLFHERVRPARLKSFSNRLKRTNLPVYSKRPLRSKRPIKIHRLDRPERYSLHETNNQPAERTCNLCLGLVKRRDCYASQRTRTKKKNQRRNMPFFYVHRFNFKRCCFGRSKLVRLARPQRNLTGERRSFARFNLACLAVGVVKTTAHLAKLEVDNKTQKCKIFYMFIISSVQLKSLGQTNSSSRGKSESCSLPACFA